MSDPEIEALFGDEQQEAAHESDEQKQAPLRKKKPRRPSACQSGKRTSKRNKARTRHSK